jgi:Secretion system C-terminal sorting domain/Beta-propeller repeat
MKRIQLLICISLAFPIIAKSQASFNSQNLFFIENKGQVKDQFGKPRCDIQYSLQGAGIVLFIGNGQVHYQFLKKDADCNSVDESRLSGHVSVSDAAFKKFDFAAVQSTGFETYRMDVELAGSNRNAEVVADQPLTYYENYYLPGCPESGICAHTFKRITCKNVYPGIDWVLSVSADKFEQEFVVKPGADASLIKLNYSGHTSLRIDEEGSIVAETPFGNIREHAPQCFNSFGNSIPSGYLLKDDILSFDVNNVTGELVIDPSVEWATYYGPDTTTSQFYGIACDSAANIYGCGLTYAGTGIATAGAFQATYAGGADAYLVKFDSSGHRLWGTYFGGSDGDWASAVGCDPAGNVYIGGSTSSLTGIATPGCAQPFYGGGLWGGFLAKFRSSGTREWATYVGGTIGSNFDLEIASVNCDNAGHVYVSGATDDSSNVATPGSFKPNKHESYDTTIDCYLIQYDTAGTKLWGTYYGGPGRNISLTGASAVDGNYVYLSGFTDDTTGNTIASPGCYQPVLKGSQDAFLAKFDVTGSRLWGTYYGGESTETAGGLAFDDIGVYLLGATASDTFMASPGCFQTARAGLDDAFIAKFDKALGMRIWGTYYGGPGDEDAQSSRIVAANGSVFITGKTSSTSGIASAGAWQTVYGGGICDAFLAAFSATGAEQWSTYYGGSLEDNGIGCAYDGKAVYLAGYTNSTSGIATPGSFQPTGGGGTFYFPGFLAKFAYPDTSTLSAGKSKLAPNGLTIFPNPVSDKITISSENEITNVAITNPLGQNIFEQAYHSQLIQVSVGQLPIGIYFIKINNSETRKFVKQ